jgi:hypothetical protein
VVYTVEVLDDLTLPAPAMAPTAKREMIAVFILKEVEMIFEKWYQED